MMPVAGSPRACRGSVSILVAATMFVSLVAVLALADLAVLTQSRVRAQTAADAAALAAVRELALPTGIEPSEAAAELARANGATLITCMCEPGTTRAAVEVELPTSGLRLLRNPPVRATAAAIASPPAATPIPTSPPAATPAPTLRPEAAG
jgi:secretion/DNA translocation related TadE-like protein